jgi:crooked neck
LRIDPHPKLTFASTWLLKAGFDVFQGDIAAARKTLGQAIDIYPKDSPFKGYINIELKMFDCNRCCALYEGYIKHCYSNSMAWNSFVELERGLTDLERVRVMFELALAKSLDLPEVSGKHTLISKKTRRWQTETTIAYDDCTTDSYPVHILSKSELPMH